MAEGEDTRYDNDFNADEPSHEHSSFVKEPGEITIDRSDAFQQNKPSANVTLESDGSPHQQTSAESTGFNLSGKSQQEQRLDPPDFNVSIGSEQEETSKLTSSNLPDGSQPEETSNSTDSKVSVGSLHGQKSILQHKAAESNFCEEALDGQGTDKQTPEQTVSHGSDVAHQNQATTSPDSNVSGKSQQKQTEESPGIKGSNISQLEQTSASPDSKDSDGSLRKHIDAKTFEPNTEPNDESITETPASTCAFGGARKGVVTSKQGAALNTDSNRPDKVTREINLLKAEAMAYTVYCEKKENDVDALLSTLKETGIRNKSEEEKYHTLQEAIRTYGLQCTLEKGKVSVLGENVTVIIEETSVGIEVIPAPISEMDQELKCLKELIKNKAKKYKAYLKRLKDLDSQRLISFAEEETRRLRKVFQTEMAEKKENFAKEKDILQMEFEILQEEMIDNQTKLTAETKTLMIDNGRLQADNDKLGKHLKDKESELSKQKNDLQILKKRCNTSETKCKELEQTIAKRDDKLKGMIKLGEKDIRNQSEIAKLKDEKQRQQDGINKLQKEKQQLYNSNVSWNAAYQEKDAEAKRYYAQWQRYNQEFEHTAEQLKDSREARNKLEQEKKELVLRLSKIAGANLTYNNPNIADLGDPNRPTKLAEMFSEIYDNEWTDAYETVLDDEEKNKIQFMLKILKDVDTICENVTKRHADAITDGLTQMVVRFKVRKGPTHPKRESDERALKLVDTHIESPASTKDVLATVKFGNPSAVNKPIKHCINEPSTSNKRDGEQGDALATHENLAKENKGTSPSQSENGNKVNQSEASEKVTSDSNKTDRNQIDETATEKNTSRNNANINTTQIENENMDNHLEHGEKKTSDLNKTDEAATNDKPHTANANINTTQSENGAQDKRLEPADKDSSTSKSTDGKHADETVTHQKQHSIIESNNSIQRENGAKKYQLESGERESSTSNKTKGEHTDETPSDEKSTSENKSTNSVQSKNVAKNLEPGEKESSAPNNTDGEKNADSVPDEKTPTDNASFNCMENKQEDDMLELCDYKKSTSNKTDDGLGDKADTKHLLENENVNLLQTKSEDDESEIRTSTIKHDFCFLGVCVEKGDGALDNSKVIQDNKRNEQEHTEKEVEVDSEHREGKDEEDVTDTTTANTEQEDAAYMEKEKGDGAFGKSAVIQNNGHNEQKHTKKEAEEEGKDGVVDKDTTPANTEQEDADYIEKVEYEERSEIIQFKFDELATAQKQYIEDIRRRVQSDLAEQVIMAICNAVLEEMGPNQADEIRNYISKCSLFCWNARLHNPPVYVDFMEVTENMRFDMSVYKPYTKTGPLVDYIVWPPIYLHKGGPMLSKGVAQGKNNS